MKKHNKNIPKNKLDPSAPFWIWGLHVLEEFASTHPSAIEDVKFLPSFEQKKTNARLLAKLKAYKVPCNLVQDFQKIDIPKDAVHQGIAALVRPFWSIELEDLKTINTIHTPSLLLICDQIVDPQNLGAIIRASVAFGVNAIIMPERSTAKVTGAVVKASSGAIAHAKLCRVGNLVHAMERLKESGFWFTALSPDGTEPIWNLDFLRNTAIVVGAEGQGVRELIKKRSDFTAYIPQAKGIASMNAAAAASVCLYEVMRQRSLAFLKHDQKTQQPSLEFT